jgi:hypothetical protein
MDAVRYGEQPEVRERLFTAVEGAVDVESIKTLVQQRKLTSEGLDPAMITAIREEMERAEVRRLQPRYIRSFFEAAFERVGGQMRRREPGRYEIVRVPAVLRERDRIAGRGDPVLPRYERICFEKGNSIGEPRAAIVAPGHPLLDSLIAVTLDRSGDVLKHGAILVDETNRFDEPTVLVMLEHAVRDGRTDRNGRPHLLSQRLQFVILDKPGQAIDAGPAPHLDLRALEDDEQEAAKKVLASDWISGDLERKAVSYAVTALVPEHLNSVRTLRLGEVDRVEREVRHRLTRAINWWDKRAEELRLQEQAGKPQRLNSTNAAATAQRLSDRLRMRLSELEAERTISALPPEVKGAALIVPAAMLRRDETAASLLAEKVSREECERLAMQSVMAAERAAGRVPIDVSAQKVGYDIESRHPETDEVRFIEVKGRHEDAEEIIVTRNEILTALNAGDRFWLALVRVANGFAHEPHYMQQPFGKEPDFGSTAVVYSIDDLAGQARAA